MPPKTESDRKEVLKEYKRLNELYGRTKVFEKGIAKALVVNSNLEK